MAKNEFEKVDSLQTDALTLELVARDGMQFGIVHCAASATNGRLPKDYSSGELAGQEAFRSAIKLANELKVPIVIFDPQDIWPADWGTLFVVEPE
jgi:hypothetical protein